MQDVNRARLVYIFYTDVRLMSINGKDPGSHSPKDKKNHSVIFLIYKRLLHEYTAQNPRVRGHAESIQ